MGQVFDMVLGVAIGAAIVFLLLAAPSGYQPTGSATVGIEGK